MLTNAPNLFHLKWLSNIPPQNSEFAFSGTLRDVGWRPSLGESLKGDTSSVLAALPTMKYYSGLYIVSLGNVKDSEGVTATHFQLNLREFFWVRFDGSDEMVCGKLRNYIRIQSCDVLNCLFSLEKVYFRCRETCVQVSKCSIDNCHILRT